MANLLKQPKIEYEQIQNEQSADRIRDAYFLLFEEMARLGRLDKLLKNKVRFISPERPSNI